MNEETKASGRGGPRNGAGLAPDLHGGRIENKTVSLDSGTISFMRDLGEGNLSLGIREAARRLSAPNRGRKIGHMK